MKALVVGNALNPYSLETFVVHALEGLGCRVLTLQWPASRAIHHPKVRRIAHALALPLPGTRRFTTTDLRQASKEADVTLLVKVPELFRRNSLSSMSESDRSVLIAPDHLCSFIDRQRIEAWVSSGGWVATFDPHTESRTLESSRVIEFKFGYDPGVHWRAREQRRSRRPGAIFVGTWDAQREAVLDALAAAVPVAVAGNFWGRARSARIEVVSGVNVYGPSAASLVQAYQFALNLPRPQNYSTGNMRTYELPAGGALPISVGQYASVLPSEVVVVPAEPDAMARSAAEQMSGMSEHLRQSVATSLQEEVRPFTYKRSITSLLDTISA